MLFIVRHTLSGVLVMDFTNVHIAPYFPLCYLLGLLDRIYSGAYIRYLYEGIG